MPQDVTFRTKPELAERRLDRALDGGVTAAWVVADAAYGDSRHLGLRLEARQQPYVLACSGKAYVWAGWGQRRVGDVLETVRHDSEADWHRLSAGDGTNGPRQSDWLRLPLNPPLEEGYERGLLVRRSREEPADLTAYTVFAPAGTTLATLVQVAGSRWQIEIAFEEAKGEVGLDEYEVRSWPGWYRHITLVLAAHAALAAMRAAGQDCEAAAKKAIVLTVKSPAAVWVLAKGSAGATRH